MEQLSWPGIGAVASLYGLFLVVGWLASRKARDGSATDFILAGRRLPLWLAVMTMTATWVDGGYLNGTTEATYNGNLAYAFQPGLCFGISLILGGIFFAGKMRRHQFTTLIDPFALRYGKGWAAVLFLPAMLGETVWSAALLVAIGSTFHVLLGLNLVFALVLSACTVTLYTLAGGMWSVAYTDALQLLLIPIGLLLALPFALEAVGGLDSAWRSYTTDNPGGARLFPPWGPTSHWSTTQLTGWWDLSLMLVFGGIPWNCYFQRVLSCPTPERARWHSILSGGLTILLVVPPLLLGLAASAYFVGAHALTTSANTLPLVLRELVPNWIGVIGLLAIVGAVTSSYSSSILSAGAMFSWNVFRVVAPETSHDRMKLILRLTIVVVSTAAAILALSSQSVYALWTFTADLVFVLLFPQLTMALFDPRSNRIGSMTAFVVSLVLRLGGGEPLFGIPVWIHYPRLLPESLVGPAAGWYDGETLLFPFRTLAALAGLILLPLVSRLTARWDPPTPLPAPPDDQAPEAIA